MSIKYIGTVDIILAPLVDITHRVWYNVNDEQ